MKLPKHLRHLGGHLGITHLDSGSLEWAIKKFNIKSFLDIGCGPGGMVRLAKKLNIESFGIDGDPTVIENNNNFHLHDYTLQPYTPNKMYDLVWSCEFVEHVEEKYIDNFLTTFKSGRYIILTHAPPGVPGRHHVNCQPATYWIDEFKKHNLIFDPLLTNELRASSTMERNFIRENGLFFINTNE